MPKCLCCPNEIEKPRRGPVPMYCSAACKQRAYRQHKKIETSNEIALLVSPDSSTKNGDPLRGIKNPPVRYTGGKFRIFPRIVSEFPTHVAYVEPFCGGASVLFRKEPSRIEVINDLNHDITNFFDVLRTRRDELVQAIILTPYAEEEYRRAFDTAGIFDPVERARRFYVRSRMSFGSSEARRTGWRFDATNSRGKGLVEEWNQTDHLLAAAQRLKQVQIASQPYEKILVRYDRPTTLFYIDPPYPASTRHENRDYYRHEMLEDEQHVLLAARLQQLQGLVILSGYDCPLYRELYASWRIVQIPTRTNGNFAATECLWINPAADVARHPDTQPDQLTMEVLNHA